MFTAASRICWNFLPGSCEYQHEQTSPNPIPFFYPCDRRIRRRRPRSGNSQTSAPGNRRRRTVTKNPGTQINGQYRRVFGERQMGGEREISILLPNKYLVEDAMNAGGLSTAMINFRGLNGDKAWSGNSGGGGGMVFRMGGPGGQQASPEQMEAMLRTNLQRRVFTLPARDDFYSASFARC